MKCARIALFILAGLPLWPGSASFGDAEQGLEELRQAIADSRQRLAEFEREQRGLLEVLERIDQTMQVLARDAARARRETVQAREALAGFEARAARIEPLLERTRRAMAIRAVALYKTGRFGPVPLLFAAGDFQELFSRIDVLQRLLEHDRRLLDRYRQQQAELAAAREHSRQAAARGEQAHARLRERGSQLEAERAAKRELLGWVRASRTQERVALVELEAAARALEETLMRLHEVPRPPQERRPGSSFAEQRGRLDPPVDLPIARSFGRAVDAEFRTQVFRKGVDFEAPLGERVRSVAAGLVRFAGWFRGYGRVLILDHGERYFTVYGHLDDIRVEVGDEVGQGEVVGTVGETGSLAGPRLYFEIREGGQALDPNDWLAPRKAG